MKELHKDKNIKNLLAISGKQYCGKSEVAKIIQELILGHSTEEIKESILNKSGTKQQRKNSGWKVKKFAELPKRMVCMLLNCTMEDLESQEFKNSTLGEKWWYYEEGNGHRFDYKSGFPTGEEEVILVKPTVRRFIQEFATDCMRHRMHPQTWVNSLFNSYKQEDRWLIDDLRFDNEYRAIKSRDGLIIRIERPTELRFPKLYSDYTNQTEYETWEDYLKSIDMYDSIYHESETQLDFHKADYTVNNDSDLESLIEQIKLILINENII